MKLNWEPAVNATQSNDRVMKLSVTPGQTSAKAISGKVDNRLFTGDNELHAIANGTLWHFKYKQGSLPPALAGKQWTNFSHAYNAAKRYFNDRGVEITEVTNA